MSYVALVVMSLILGVVAKYADLVNEHGLKELFPGAGLLAGLIWGLAGMGLVVVSPLTGLTYIAHVLYWFQRIKLEYPNHATAGVLIVLSGFLFQGEFMAAHAVELVIVFLGYTATGYIQAWFKERYPATRKFWRLRLRIYAVPLVYSVYHWDIEPILATTVGMIGCEFLTLRYREYMEDRALSRFRSFTPLAVLDETSSGPRPSRSATG